MEQQTAVVSGNWCLRGFTAACRWSDDAVNKAAVDLFGILEAC